VNRKLVQHAFHVMGWTMPQMTKKRLIGATHEKPKPTVKPGLGDRSDPHMGWRPR
jgi:hypothetical protein